METTPSILELVDKEFMPVEWSNFVKLTPREIARRPLVLKIYGLYFVGDGWGTDVSKYVAKKHSGKVRHLIEWLEVVLPYWTSDMMDTPLIKLPLRKINEGNASEILKRIKGLVKFQTEVIA